MGRLCCRSRMLYSGNTVSSFCRYLGFGLTAAQWIGVIWNSKRGYYTARIRYFFCMVFQLLWGSYNRYMSHMKRRLPYIRWRVLLCAANMPCIHRIKKNRNICSAYKRFWPCKQIFDMFSFVTHILMDGSIQTKLYADVQVYQETRYLIRY